MQRPGLDREAPQAPRPHRGRQPRRPSQPRHALWGSRPSAGDDTTRVCRRHQLTRVDRDGLVPPYQCQSGRCSGGCRLGTIQMVATRWEVVAKTAREDG